MLQCQRIVVRVSSSHKIILAFSVNATFKFKIEFSFSSTNHTFSLIYNFLQAAAKKVYSKLTFILLKKTIWISCGFLKHRVTPNKSQTIFKKCLNKNVPTHAKIQNTINTEIIAQLKAPHML